MDYYTFKAYHFEFQIGSLSKASIDNVVIEERRYENRIIPFKYYKLRWEIVFI